MINPYWKATFGEFFATLFQRIANGEIASLAPDELQLAVLSATAISCGLIGPFLVLKRMAMFANALSHTILIGILGAFLLARAISPGESSALFDFSTLLIGAFAAALLTAFFTEALTRFFRLQEDASIGLVFTALFALGIAAASLYTRQMHLGIESIMGNPDALHPSDLQLACQLLAINALSILLFYKRFLLISFDRSLAETLGIRCSLFHFWLLFLVALSAVGAFRAIGALLVLSYLVGPYLIARLFCHRLTRLLCLSAAIGVAISAIGVALARHLLTAYDLPLSTGGIVSTLLGLAYFSALWLKSLFSAKLRHLTPASACPKKSLS